MYSNNENYFAKEYFELVLRAIDYIENNIDRLSNLGDKLFDVFDDRITLAKVISVYKRQAYEEGLGLSILAWASMLKSIIDDNEIKNKKTGKLFIFFEYEGKFYLKT